MVMLAHSILAKSDSLITFLRRTHVLINFEEVSILKLPSSPPFWAVPKDRYETKSITYSGSTGSAACELAARSSTRRRANRPAKRVDAFREAGRTPCESGQVMSELSVVAFDRVGLALVVMARRSPQWHSPGRC
jgi:hypothetical protein